MGLAIKERMDGVFQSFQSRIILNFRVRLPAAIDTVECGRDIKDFTAHFKKVSIQNLIGG